MSAESSTAKQIFKWTDPSNFITDRLRSFYENKELLDATLIAGPEYVKIEAHKLVLSSWSNYLLAAFRSSNSGEIKLPEIDGITAKKIVDFMYTGSIEISVATVRSIVEAATLLQMKTLTDACLGFMEQQLDATNCLGIARLAQQHNYTNLFEKASSFAYANFDQVSMGKEFAELTEEELIAFLSSEDPQPTVVESVCQRSLVPWLEHDRENREKNIFGVLYKVLDRKFHNEKGLTIVNTIECYKSFCSWLRSQSEPKSYQQFLVYLSGSTTDYLQMQIFNRQLNTWSNEKVPSVPVWKKEQCQIIMNKKLIIIGGKDENFKDTNSVECLDLETKEWSNLPPMKNKRSYCGAAELNGDLYVLGGWCDQKTITSVEKYNFGTGKWQDVKPLESRLLEYMGTAVLDGKLYVMEEYNENFMHCYDPIKDEWTKKTCRTKLNASCYIAAVGPYIYAVDSDDTTVKRYNPATGSWSYVSSLKEPVLKPRCTSLNNRLVVCGHETDDESNTIIVQEYNPETNEWEILAPLTDDNLIFYHYFAALFAM